MTRVITFIAASFFILIASCKKDQYLSPDVNNLGLLPNRNDYLNENYGTQTLAKEIAGAYSADIGLVIYDEVTRTKPVLYLTRGNTKITIEPLKSGAVNISYQDFQTLLMPLKMSLNIKGLLEKRNDTIFIKGTDGKVRTKSGKEMPIGTPLPESDDAELVGTYIIHNKTMGMLIDLMLPIPVKALVRIEKEKS